MTLMYIDLKDLISHGRSYSLERQRMQWQWQWKWK